MSEFLICKGSAEWDLKHIDEMTQPICEETELMFAPAKTYMRYEPLGICAIFGAWNYPWTVNMKPLI